MAVPVDFTTVSAQGLETSEHPEALAGLRANEARYFHNKFKHTFEVSPASEEPYALAWVTQILAEERDITIASQPWRSASMTLRESTGCMCFTRRAWRSTCCGRWRIPENGQ